MNLDSDAALAFGEDALTAGPHGAPAVPAQWRRRRAQHLEQALAPAREIGTAVGVLMARYRLTRPQTLAKMRAAAQDSTRPVAELAAEVNRTEIRRLPPMPTATPVHPGRPRTTPDDPEGDP